MAVLRDQREVSSSPVLTTMFLHSRLAERSTSMIGRGTWLQEPEPVSSTYAEATIGASTGSGREY